MEYKPEFKNFRSLVEEHSKQAHFGESISVQTKLTICPCGLDQYTLYDLDTILVKLQDFSRVLESDDYEILFEVDLLFLKRLIDANQCSSLVTSILSICSHFITNFEDDFFSGDLASILKFGFLNLQSNFEMVYPPLFQLLSKSNKDINEYALHCVLDCNYDFNAFLTSIYSEQFLKLLHIIIRKVNIPTICLPILIVIIKEFFELRLISPKFIDIVTIIIDEYENIEELDYIIDYLFEHKEGFSEYLLLKIWLMQIKIYRNIDSIEYLKKLLDSPYDDLTSDFLIFLFEIEMTHSNCHVLFNIVYYVIKNCQHETKVTAKFLFERNISDFWVGYKDHIDAIRISEYLIELRSEIYE